MKKQITLINDKLGNPYLAIKIDYETIQKIINSYKIPEIFELNRINRDGKDYHITISHNVKLFEYFKNKWFNLKLLGIGEASYKNDIAFYIVVESEEINSILEKYEVRRDLHITIGFDNKDVFICKKDFNTIKFLF